MSSPCCLTYMYFSLGSLAVSGLLWFLFAYIFFFVSTCSLFIYALDVFPTICAALLITRESNLCFGSTKCTMEDSFVTIEFLRARLLSERSVSKTARQRADELAKRVEELEEQLRIVSVQRMKAEKATANVLTILESNGLSDASEAFDSSSDQDAESEFGLVNGCTKEVECSVNSKSRKGKSEEHSGSDLDFSPSPARSLSWKSSKDGTGFIKRCKDPAPRRSTTSSSSSTKHRLGKSCRQIRRREARDRDMEKALEQQAELIERYDDMEKAQREWEEKFRENASSTPDSCDPGNRSDVTEEAPYETKEQSPHTVGSTARIAKSEVEELPKVQSNGNRQHAVIGEQEISIPPASGSPGRGFPCSIVERKQNDDQVANNYIKSSSFSTSHQLLQPHSSNGSPESQLTANLLSVRAGDKNKEKAPGSQTEVYALIPHQAPKELGILEALKLAKQTLQQQMKNKIPSVASSPDGTSYDPSLLIAGPGDKPDIPVGCPGLFRLPTELPARGSGETKFQQEQMKSKIQSVVGSPVGMPGDRAELLSVGYPGLFRLPTDFPSRVKGEANERTSLGNELLGLGNHHPRQTNPAASASNQLVGMRQTNFLIDDQLLPGKQYPEDGSRKTSHVDPSLDVGLPAYPTFPASPAYGDLMFRMPSPSEGFSMGRITDGDVMSRQTSIFSPDGIPPADRFSFSSPYRSDMYR
ncbi:hypothetical protein LINGRAHAP2_LOCUS20953 [Linum grandiflorum]